MVFIRRLCNNCFDFKVKRKSKEKYAGKINYNTNKIIKSFQVIKVIICLLFMFLISHFNFLENKLDFRGVIVIF